MAETAEHVIHNIADVIHDRQMTDADKIIQIYRILQNVTLAALREE